MISKHIQFEELGFIVMFMESLYLESYCNILNETQYITYEWEDKDSSKVLNEFKE